MRKTVLLLLLSVVLISCSRQPAVVHIIQTHSLQGMINPVEKDGQFWGGLNLISGFIQSLKTQEEGDFINLATFNTIYGTPEAFFTDAEPLITLMNSMDYDGLIIGPREFYFGKEVLKDRAAQADFPFLSANLITETGTTPDFIQPVLYHETSRTGIIPLSPPQVLTQNLPENIEGFQLTETLATVEKYAGELKKSGAEFIMVIAGGLASYDGEDIPDVLKDILAVEGINAVQVSPLKPENAGLYPLGERQEDRKYILSVFAHSRSYRKTVDIYTPLTGEYKAFTVNSGNSAPDLTMKDVLADVSNSLNSLLNDQLGHSEREIPHSFNTESPLGNLVTDALREYMETDVLVLNSGTIRSSFPSGKINFSDVYMVLPFGGNLVRTTVTGRQLLKILEFGTTFKNHPEKGRGFLQVSGVQFLFDSSKEINRVQRESITIGNSPLIEEKNYSFATDRYIFSGGDGYTIFKEEAITASETEIKSSVWILADSIREHKTLSNRIDGRIIDIAVPEN